MERCAIALTIGETDVNCLRKPIHVSQHGYKHKGSQGRGDREGGASKGVQ